MAQYKELDKDLKKIRNSKKFDLYEINLESQKKIDQFYSEDIAENDMMARKYSLESYIDRRNGLYIPIVITILFGLLVNEVFNLESIPNFGEMFQELQAIPITNENLIIITKIYIMLIALISFVVLTVAFLFFIPLPPLNLVLDMGENTVYQKKYELQILNEKIEDRLRENKNGKEYVSNSQNKCVTKPLILAFIMMVMAITIGYSWKIPLYKTLVLIIMGCVVMHFIIPFHKK